MFRPMVPMPSPRGTNHARLFIPARGPAGAYDAARGIISYDALFGAAERNATTSTDTDFTGPKGFRGEPRDRQALQDKNARTTVDESPIGRVLEYLRGKLTPEDHSKLAGILSGPAEDSLDSPLNADPAEILEEIRQVCDSDEDPLDQLGAIKAVLARGRLSADDAPPPFPGEPLRGGAMRPAYTGEPLRRGAQDAALRSRLATAEGVRQGRAAESYEAMFGKIGGGR